MHIEDLVSDNIDFSLFERTDHDISNDMIRRSEYRGTHLVQLNFEKINQCLASEDNNEEKKSLLQALRLRITKTRGIFAKREVVVSYVHFDLLGLKRNDGFLRSLLRNKD